MIGHSTGWNRESNRARPVAEPNCMFGLSLGEIVNTN